MIALAATSDGLHVVRVNPAYERFFGRSAATAEGVRWNLALGGAPWLEDIEPALSGSDVVERTGPIDIDGEPRWCKLVARQVIGADRRSAQVVVTLHDVGDAVAAEQARAFLASHDAVSGLLHPGQVKDNLAAELVRAVTQCHRLFVCYVDIDKFGAFNQTDGFEAGDRLLRLIADRLVAGGRDVSLLSRIAGDEFIVGGIDATGDADMLDVGQQLLDELKQPVSLGTVQVRLGASIGIACFPDTAASAEDLLQQSALAARTAKERGGHRVHVFNARQRELLKDRMDMGAHLRGAVARGELELAYQPVVNAAKREITGMEALVRWCSPQLGLVTPDRFIPLAEDLGLIADIGQWVLVQACQQARRWLDCGVGDFVLSVNVSGLQMRGQQVIEDVSRALDGARLPARYLELELTEKAIMGDPDHVASLMRELRKIGVSLSMDDFGIGHSSLGLMQRFPVNRLKIDRTFVSAVPNDIGAARICRAIIGLAHEFGCTVVAEGVETALQLGFLERNGCEFAQGNHLGEPVSADAMLARLRNPSLQNAEGAHRGDAGSVLLVDDEQNVLRALARLLRRDGYTIHTAGTFQQAFDILGTASVDVVVSDHRMPEGRGTEFLGKVKETHPRTIRMILSGYADIGAVTEAINGGAVYRFLTKPWVDDDLRRVIRDAVSAARREPQGHATSHAGDPRPS
ncbi:EAL domain-containing protein [Frateuria sp.]|uniref:EAL domain-containing protein n=1 Tax=Frateuria sp. TaxID=2211372 RepID=UPI002D7E311D|nr:EAL domain-containing protein [Frateuria sp.]